MNETNNTSSNEATESTKRIIPVRKTSLAERRNVKTLIVDVETATNRIPLIVQLDPSPIADSPDGLSENDYIKPHSQQREICSRPHIVHLDSSNNSSSSSDNESSKDDQKKLFNSNKSYIERTPLRTKRRNSVAPLPSLRLNDKEIIIKEMDSQNIMTSANQNSVTSVNSLASLLKEKMQSFPTMMRRKKPVTSDVKIKAFVSLLFLIIIFLVGYAYIMYHQKVLAHLYFDKVKFDKMQRSFKVYNKNGIELITGTLGVNIPPGKPYHCIGNNTITNPDIICLEWDRIARLYISYEFDDEYEIDCYNIRWQSLNENHYPEDCFDFKKLKGHWYGGGITKSNDWPFDEAEFDYAPFVTGDALTNQFGNALNRYFISSGGVAITIDERTPLHVKMTKKLSKEFCMKAMNDRFSFVNRLTEKPELRYKIYSGLNMKILHEHIMKENLWNNLNETKIQVVHSILEEPVWQISASNINELNESSIYNYTENVIELGFVRLGHVLINEFWQKYMGDFSLDTKRFPTLENTINMLHRRGFKVVFTVQPFISTDSDNFADAIKKKILIYERLSERSIPALTRYKSSPSSGVLDVTNNESIPWLLEKLNKIINNYKIDSFYFDYGTGYNMPHYYQCSRSLINPDQYKTIFTNILTDKAVPMFGISGAVKLPKPPIFLGLPPVNSSWEGLQSIIRTALSYGVIGFPFILPGPVGGDYYLPKMESHMILSYKAIKQPPLPTPELFIRWLQLATFLPSIRYSHLPSEYKSEMVTEVAKDLTNIRQKIILPIMKKYVASALNKGLPLIRPLWMIDVQDPSCLYVNDEFAIGDEMIVAPILNEGQTKREVYLPQGVWKDGVDGSLRKGSRWIHNYRVPLEKVAYFVKMPDNIRF